MIMKNFKKYKDKNIVIHVIFKIKNLSYKNNCLIFEII